MIDPLIPPILRPCQKHEIPRTELHALDIFIIQPALDPLLFSKEIFGNIRCHRGITSVSECLSYLLIRTPYKRTAVIIPFLHPPWLAVFSLANLLCCIYHLF